MQDDINIFKACSDHTRLRVLFLLSERELCVCELVAILDMPQGKVSRHLAILKNAGLVADRRDGTWIYYALTIPDNSLKQRLTDYLKHDRDHLEEVIEDLKHLDKLAYAGEICVPRPSFPINANN